MSLEQSLDIWLEQHGDRTVYEDLLIDNDSKLCVFMQGFDRTRKIYYLPVCYQPLVGDIFCGQNGDTVNKVFIPVKLFPNNPQVINSPVDNLVLH